MIQSIPASQQRTIKGPGTIEVLEGQVEISHQCYMTFTLAPGKEIPIPPNGWSQVTATEHAEVVLTDSEK